LNYKTEFNVKGHLTDKLDDGQLKGEFDVSLPTGHHFTGKVSSASISCLALRYVFKVAGRTDRRTFHHYVRFVQIKSVWGLFLVKE
jgi:hypothetical protein